MRGLRLTAVAIRRAGWAFGVLCLGSLAAGAEAPVAPGRIIASQLRCEYQTAPLGIDVARPRFSWFCRASDAQQDRGLKQTAYQIQVASAGSILEQGTGDLWDSQKVATDQSILVAYSGQPLQATRQYCWRVRLWDELGQASAWSPPATFAMGLLKPADWTAQWIGGPKSLERSLRGCNWVWCGEPDARGMYPPGTRYFRKRFSLPAAAKVVAAEVLMTADNGFQFFLNGHRALQGEAYNTVFPAEVTRLLVPGENTLAVAGTNGGNGPNEAGLIGKLTLRLEQGQEIVVPVDASWKTSDREQTQWQTAAFDDTSWPAVHVLGPYGRAPWKELTSVAAALPLLRREFELPKAVRRATVFVCGLGQYELHINGRRIGDRELDPGWTNYRRTCQYSTYDVTANLAPGKNALGVLLGNGMYNVTGGRYVKFTGSFGEPKLILQLVVEHGDGTTTVLGTDDNWKTAGGPITFTCIFGGEDYDARREQPGWDRVGFDDAAWQSAAKVPGPGGELRSQLAPPVKVIAEFRPVKITQPRPGVFVYDLGHNASAQPQLAVRGPAGATLKLIPGELLDQAGLVTQQSSGGPTWFSYTLRGSGDETWAPRFSYYGYRYLQLEGAVPIEQSSGAADLPRVLALRSQFLSSSAEVAGNFACSNPLINQIHELILAAIKSNLHSVLTDCPHREKLGWLEVSHLLARSIMYNRDVPRFYAKISRDMRESQLDNGLVPDIAPEFTVFGGGFRDSPEWGSACVYNPWHVYQMYGDRSLLDENYEVMRRYVEYLGTTAQGGIVKHGLGDWYDIGPRGPGESQLTSPGLTATALYFGDLAIVAETARGLGKLDDAQRLTQKMTQVRAAFNSQFFQSASNQYDRNSQTANALPLVLGLVDEPRRSAVLDNLVALFRGNRNHVTAGDVGFTYVVQALSDGGRGDVLYDLVTQTDGPGYAYQLKRGATTLTEAWDTNPSSSQNHCMLGHVEEWFYRGLAGIVPDPRAPGFKQFRLQPQVVGNVTWVRAHFDAVYGRIVSNWRVADGVFAWEVTVPPNTTATLVFPEQVGPEITESQRLLKQVAGVEAGPGASGLMTFTASSGSYRFAAPWRGQDQSVKPTKK